MSQQPNALVNLTRHAKPGQNPDPDSLLAGSTTFSTDGQTVQPLQEVTSGSTG